MKVFGDSEEIISRELVDAKDDAWFQARREGITATDIGAITGNSAFGKTAFTVYWTKIADLRSPSNEQMDVGTDWQDDVLKRAYELGKKTYAWDYVAKPGLLRSQEVGWMLASVDALVREGDIWVPLEIKTSAKYEGFGTDGTDEIPRDYWLQVAWQAMVVGSNYGYLAVMMPSHRIHIYRVERNSDWDWAYREAESFRDTYLIPENPPEVVGTGSELAVMKKVSKLNTEMTIKVDPELHSLISELRHLRSTKRDYERLIESCEVRLLERMGDASTVVGINDEPLIVRNVVKRKGYSVEPTEFKTLRLPRERKVEEL